MSNIPANLKYSKEHEWLKLENGIAVVGITDFAQQALGDVVYLELPELGAKLSKDKTFGVIESIKSVSDLFAPVSGEVVERNEDLINSPEQTNTDPYSAWMIKLKITSPDEMNHLLSDEEYRQHCQS